MNLFNRSALFCLAIVATTSVSQSPPKATPNLRAFASLPHSTICSSVKELQLDITLINLGSSAYQFDSKQFVVRPAYGALVDTSTMKRRVAGFTVQQDRIPVPQSPSFVLLGEKQSYVHHLSLSLADKFFDAPGFYVLMPSISLESFSVAPDPKTGIIFELRDCE